MNWEKELTALVLAENKYIRDTCRRRTKEEGLPESFLSIEWLNRATQICETLIKEWAWNSKNQQKSPLGDEWALIIPISN